uniref:Uncharacterized protein n=1 Tax=Haptolina ericina TaxID=156174 RepID=A0A7S3AU50_9EUKA|eukprot:CAMPEP_0181196504 /NCGR_PEP_ID=MMETSP1096-20121128/15505_1 /TAXON_ID=156174 ORGANISM="Chrysochromulina ericina, Strain CCMP281" /NCGR_SAMPLE_ID=MMETSP1096 /ASSEMBLY_ACC=CAM_ASM_000453 /LENGTH=129 /DNA_ID=CAMNT_0023286277 /DNA_START=76 /DNA_END=465 /DNA_ORIENTATION=-
MNALARNAARNAARLQTKFVRQMGGHSMEEAVAETSKWQKVSYVALPACTLFGIVVYIKEMQHEHHHAPAEPKKAKIGLAAPDRIAYPYIAKRDKPYPWTLAGGSECALFDFKCSAAEKALKAGASVEH